MRPWIVLFIHNTFKSIDKFPPWNIHTGIHHGPAVYRMQCQLTPALCCVRSSVSSLLVRPAGAHVQGEKDSGAAGKTSEHLKLNSSLLDPFGLWTTVTVFSKASCTEPQYPLSHIKSPHVWPPDLWRLYQCPCSSFSCKWQLQSSQNGQKQHLLWLSSACSARWSYWQALKPPQTEGDCASPVALLRQLFS